MSYRPLGACAGLLSLILLTACGGSSSTTPTGATAGTGAVSPVPSEGSTSTTGRSDGPAAIVNGEEIARAEFEEQLDQVQASYQQQGLTFPQGEELNQLHQLIMTRLVQKTLLLQEAEARGVTASDEEVRSDYDGMMAGFADEAAFKQALVDEGLSEAELQELISENVKLRKLLASVVDEATLDTPTEDELRALYEVVRQQQDLPPFEEVRSYLEAELLAQRQDEVVQRFIEELEQRSTIEVLL